MVVKHEISDGSRILKRERIYGGLSGELAPSGKFITAVYL